MKRLVLGFLILLVSACGQELKSRDTIEITKTPEPAAPAFQEPISPPVPVVIGPEIDASVDEACLKAKDGGLGLADFAVPLCKTLKNGKISTVTIIRGENVVDPDTCAISYRSKDLIHILMSMEYKKC